MLTQTRLAKDVTLRKPYSYGPYNVVRGKEQRIRISSCCSGLIHNLRRDGTSLA